jgi:two-component system sensor histidine kinase GlrK
MKVSSKIISGFLVLMLLAIVVVANQLSAIHQMRAVNQELSEINVKSATTVLQMQKLADLLGEDSRKYFAGLDPLYAQQIADVRSDFLEDLARLRETARSGREQEGTTALAKALDDYWRVFNSLKEQNRSWDPDELPPDLTIAVNHLQAQAEIMLDAVQVAIKERVASAAELGQVAERLSWIAGMFALVLGVLVAGLILRSINDPLRRLMHGTRAIAKGQFWHRLPARGNDEFAELARDFNVMTERLGELDQMKKDFVSHVSHDLKAPLASIRQIMHLLLQEIPGSLNEQQKNLIQLSYNSAERLAAMVGNLLDVSRMEAGTMEYQMAAHDIIPLIKGVIEEFDVQAREKEIRFRLEFDQPCIFVECDRERIVQVIGNLYENALKFSPSHAEIVTRAGQGKGGEILVSVSDSGPGVPDGHKEKIFQKFHQAKQGKKVAGQGVGLGLAICKTIVEAHRGQIWVEDNPSGGSVFSFVLQHATREEALICGQTA